MLRSLAMLITIGSTLAFTAPRTNVEGDQCCGDQCSSDSDCAAGLFCCPNHLECMDTTTKSTIGPNCDACNPPSSPTLAEKKCDGPKVWVPRSAADDCSTYTSCQSCSAGCTWANKWDSTGWHCFADGDVEKDWLVMDSVDCMDCAQPDEGKSCDKCNKKICGWCGGDRSDTCMSDNDSNEGLCQDKDQTWTGSSDDCPSV